MNNQYSTIIRSIAIILIVILGGFVAFQNIPSRTQETQAVEDDLALDMIFAEINGEKISIDTSKDHSTFEFNQLYTNKSIPVKFHVNESIVDNIDISINGKKMENKQGNVVSGDIELSRIAKDELVPMTISYGKNKRIYYIQTLPENFQEFHFEGKTSADKGKFYYANQYAGFEDYGDQEFERDNCIVKYNDKGDIVFYKRDHDLELVNFNRFDTEDGFSGYYYFQQNDNGLEHNYQPFRKGEMVILDEDYNIIDTVVPQQTEIYNVSAPKVEVHDFKVLGKDHYLMFDSYDGYSEKYGIQKQEIYIQEIKDNQVIWEWYSGDHDMFKNAKVQEELTQNNVDVKKEKFLDNIHLNAMDVDPKDGNIVISNRNMNNVVKIDKATGDILWVLGGDDNEFDLNGMRPFIRQHDAHYNDKGQLVLYDNAIIYKRSRGLILDLDEENKKIIGYKEFSDGEQRGVFTGNVEELNDDFTFVNWGMQKEEPTIGTIFDKDGNVVKRIIPNEQDPIETYRVYINDK